MIIIIISLALAVLALGIWLLSISYYVNEVAKFQSITSKHLEVCLLELAATEIKLSKLEEEAKRQGWPYNPTEN